MIYNYRNFKVLNSGYLPLATVFLRVFLLFTRYFLRCIHRFIFRYDYPDVIAGQGTLGLEIVEQVSNIDAVVVPIGGGGLIAGVALAVKNLHPNVTIIVSDRIFPPSFSFSPHRGLDGDIRIPLFPAANFYRASSRRSVPVSTRHERRIDRRTLV